MLKPQEFTIDLDGRRVQYRAVTSRSARKLRVRIGPGGVEVTRPAGRSDSEVTSFLFERSPWVLAQLRRVDRLRAIRRPQNCVAGRILFRGDSTRIRVEVEPNRARRNTVFRVDDEIVLRQGGGCVTPPSQSLETWLRKQARSAIEAELEMLKPRLRQEPGRVYVMDQRTKWGNCSAQRNLSFNWRLILAPDYVLRYLVTHEAVHLAVPDHSAKFWLLVQSLCPETERAKQWLSAQGRELWVDLEAACRA